MTDLFGPTDEALEGIYAGVAPTEDLEEVAAFMLEVKTTCSASPREETAGRHLAAMLEESRRSESARPLTQEAVVVSDRSRWRRAMDRTISTVLKGAAGVLAASMSMMGLAYAGVDLPGQAAANAIEAVTGVELPNQNDGGENGKSVADDVKAVVESDAEKGCEFGQAVAAAASQNAKGDGPGSEEACTEDGDEGSGEPQGSKATGDEKSAGGRATATEKSGGASDAGSHNATTGTDRAGSGADNPTTGKATAEEKTSGAGTDDTDEADDSDDDAADGQGTASEKSGGASGAGSDRRP